MTRAAVPAPRRPLSAVVRDSAVRNPRGAAYIEPDRQLDWAGYDVLSDRLALELVAAGLARG